MQSLASIINIGRDIHAITKVLGKMSGINTLKLNNLDVYSQGMVFELLILNVLLCVLYSNALYIYIIQ